MDNDNGRVAVALCFGAVVTEPYPCKLCQQLVDQLGRDGLPCDKSATAGRLARHANINDALRRVLGSAGLEGGWSPPA